jgi:branched-chain amino acid transport system ATP-binding protein
VARTFQISKLFGNMTVLENVLVPALAERGLDGERRAVGDIHERARRVLELVLLDRQRHALAKELSGGQSMLLQIARGLMLRSVRLFLMDEPFAGVHPTIKDTIMATILKANGEEGVTFVIVSHEMATLRRLASRVSVMHEGRLIAEGSFESVANQALVLEAYLGG